MWHVFLVLSSSPVFGWGSLEWGSQLAISGLGVLQCKSLIILLRGFFFFQSRFITLCVFMPVAFQAKIAIVIYFRGSGRWALPDTACEQSAEAVSQ